MSDKYDQKMKDLLTSRYGGDTAEKLIKEIKTSLTAGLSDDEIMGRLIKILKKDLTDAEILNIRDLFVIRPISVHGV